MAFPAAFVAADWSKDPRKRSVHVVDFEERSIRRAESPRWTLTALLDLARDLRGAGPVLVGLDLVLGVPAGYWGEVKSQERWRGVDSFVEWLETIDPESDFFEPVADPGTWRIERPFFRVPPGKGGLDAFQSRLEGGLRRRVDVRTQAKPPFAVSGIPGTVGSGTRTLWRDLIPLLRQTRDFAVWPFEGELEFLLALQRIVLAETYPALAYAAALADTLPTGRLTIAKTHRKARELACDRLQSAAWVRQAGVDLGDLEPARRDEDAFDSHLMAAAMLRCVLDDVPLGHPGWIDPDAEGGMLPAGPVDPARKATWLKTAAGGRRGAPTERSRRPAAPEPARVAAPRGHRCPIPGCPKIFRTGRAGWDGHVGSLRMHPDWHPELEDPQERKRRFRQEFGSWLE
jgi:hypothetical protein